MGLYTIAKELAKSGKKPLDIARDMGIEVQFVPFHKIKGLALSMGNQKIIIIDNGLSEAERQFVCGHELGHFLLHPSTNFKFIFENTLSYSKQEYQANRFACTLMLGEKAEEYSYTITEIAAAGKLDQLARLVWELADKDDEVP